MSNELVIKKDELVTVIENQGLTEVIKPLVNEIYLFDTYIAGTSYIQDKNIFNEIQKNQQLVLKREDNAYDDKAIIVSTIEGNKLGYIPERDNIIFSRLMDGGKLLTAKVISHEETRGYHKIQIGIYLVDF